MAEEEDVIADGGAKVSFGEVDINELDDVLDVRVPGEDDIVAPEAFSFAAGDTTRLEDRRFTDLGGCGSASLVGVSLSGLLVFKVVLDEEPVGWEAEAA